MNKNNLFDDGMSSRQIALKYFSLCDSVKGNERELLDNQFNKAFKKAQTKELIYAFEHSENGSVYVAQ